ncbi:fimbrial biogenesis chaperone [Pantoea ananatis]|uniref:fimbrial biogenesis chaperone n=2 Tax=Erwiniaceae TaxID=1903409 RepID=UPI000B7F1B3B|nr:molecular chaperone [Pantoea ananatis]AWQ20078.1 molecular chaperone [Pantoea ananatis]MBN6030639.1 molecular chaperone [Pantoea ananatis]MCW1775013.1 molecular chaperone [Pantoea ananatis]QZE28715.1 molecular chaperone [Pantoea ananatis]USL57667.1 molecular chaperone [Pantoea ananatis]
MRTLLWLFMCLAINVQAAVIPQQSRLIFHPGEVQIPLLLVNSGDAPVLIQTWIDGGSPERSPGSKAFPFVALPGVFTLNKDEKKQIAVLRTELAAQLPKDRESLYWLNLYEISAVKKSTLRPGSDKISMALNTQLKVINRPFREVIPFSARVHAVTFQVRKKQGQAFIHATNGSRYFFTPGKMTVVVGGKRYAVYLDGDKTLAPFSSKDYPLMGDVPLTASHLLLDYTALDDEGNPQAFSARIDPPSASS